MIEQIDTTVKSDKKKNIPNRIYSFIKKTPAKTTIAYETYWKFAAERQSIFFKRYRNEPAPWTDDSILSKHKFTNTYRVCDRVSQYLISKVIYGEGDHTEEEVFFRTILFKLFNKIETWEQISKVVGVPSHKNYSFQIYDEILTGLMNNNERIFSAAYIMPSGSSTFKNKRKHRNCLMLLELMMSEKVPLKIGNLKRMQQGFELIRSFPMIGDFLAYQFVTDINYSELTNFTEMEFVVPGPGAKNGLRKCFKNFGGLNEEELILLMVENQEEEFERLGLKFQTLWGRPLQLIDCQNIFCEVDKYSRIAHPEIKVGKKNRTRIKQLFRPDFESINYCFPSKWNLLNKKGESNEVATPRDKT